MNENARKDFPEKATAPSSRDVVRLKTVIGQIVKCCEDRRMYERGRFDLPYGQLRCLMTLDGVRYRTVKEIAREMDVAKSRVTYIVDHLLEKRLVSRTEDPADARVRIVGLTAEGRKKAREINAFYDEIHARVLSRVDTPDREELLRTLETLSEAMDNVKKALE